MNKKQLLKVPGKWLAACGLGTEDKTFPVLDIETKTLFGHQATFVKVNRDGSPWTVHMEARGAELIEDRMPMITEAYQAHAPGHSSATESTPRQAAITFFTKNPRAHKCNVSQGHIETRAGTDYFVTVLSRDSRRWPDVTRKQAETLPAA